MKEHIVKFRIINRDVFLAVKEGKKRIETRAASRKYNRVKKADVLVLVCGKQKLKRKVIKVEHFNSVTEILKKYKPKMINPELKSTKQARDMWNSFPGYKEKIKKFGLLAFHI